MAYQTMCPYYYNISCVPAPAPVAVPYQTYATCPMTPNVPFAAAYPPISPPRVPPPPMYQQAPMNNRKSSSSSDSLDVENLTSVFQNMQVSGEKPLGIYGPDGQWYPLSTIPLLPKEVQEGIFLSKQVDSTNVQLDSTSENSSTDNSSNSLESSETVKPVLQLYDACKANRLSGVRPVFLALQGSIKGKKMYRDLQNAWSKHFVIRFKEFEHLWLFGKAKDGESKDGWNCFQDHAKVRFYCNSCKRGWTSMHGIVAYYHRFNQQFTYGEVNFRVFGQQCSTCKEEFILPSWYPEEAEKTMENLYKEIAHRYYSKAAGTKSKMRRFGKPIRTHSSDGCEGCQVGLCNLKKSSDRVEKLVTIIENM